MQLVIRKLGNASFVCWVVTAKINSPEGDDLKLCQPPAIPSTSPHELADADLHQTWSHKHIRIHVQIEYLLQHIWEEEQETSPDEAHLPTPCLFWMGDKGAKRLIQSQQTARPPLTEPYMD